MDNEKMTSRLALMMPPLQLAAGIVTALVQEHMLMLPTPEDLIRRGSFLRRTTLSAATLFTDEKGKNSFRSPP